MASDKIKNYVISEDASIIQAMKQLDQAARKILVVLDAQGRLKATITDGDIRRWILKSGDLSSRISKAMNRSPKFIDQPNIQKALELMKQFRVEAVPVVDKDGKLADVIFWHDVYDENSSAEDSSLTGVTVVIMTGGKGTRLYPYTKILPKPLIPIGDIPIIERITDKYFGFGVRKFIFIVNYHKNMIKSYFSELVKDYAVEYIDEPKPLGTGGGLRLLRGLVKNPFFVSNCDVLIEADYGDVYRFHTTRGNEMTIVGALKNIVIPYGVIRAGINGSIEHMEEKPEFPYLINTGMYVLAPSALDEIPHNSCFQITELAQNLIQKGLKVGVYPVSEESYFDMGQFDEMERMKRKLGID